MQKLGFGLSKDAVNYTVLQILKAHGRENQHPFSKKGPGPDWWSRFLKNHSELSFRTPQALTEARAQRANEVIVKDHFEKLATTVQTHSLTPDRIWNMDETGFQITGRLQKVLARRGSRNVHKIQAGDSQQHVTLVPTISAGGTYIPPMFIFKGVRVIPTLLQGALAGSVMAFTETGYMRENVFRQYVEHFARSIPSVRPVLLMMDGHASHIDGDSVKFCHANGIILFALPPNTTHILQPAEIPFRKLKSEFDKACDHYRQINNGAQVTKETFAQVLSKAYLETYIPSAIIKAFAKTGTWPVNPEAISTDRLAPSLRTQQSAPTPAPAPAHKNNVRTRQSEIYQLRKELQALKEENARLKHPGTTSLATILRYPFQSKDINTQPKKKRRTFPFARILTEDEAIAAAKKLEEEKEQKMEDQRRRKEERAQKNIDKKAGKAQKTFDKMTKGQVKRGRKRKLVLDEEKENNN